MVAAHFCFLLLGRTGQTTGQGLLNQVRATPCKIHTLSGSQAFQPMQRAMKSSHANTCQKIRNHPRPQRSAWTTEVECQTPAHGTNPNSCSVGSAPVRTLQKKRCTTGKKVLAYRGRGGQNTGNVFLAQVRGGSYLPNLTMETLWVRNRSRLGLRPQGPSVYAWNAMCFPEGLRHRATIFYTRDVRFSPTIQGK